MVSPILHSFLFLSIALNEVSSYRIKATVVQREKANTEADQLSQSVSVQDLLAAGLPRISEVVKNEVDDGECGTEEEALATTLTNIMPSKVNVSMQGFRPSCFAAARARSSLYEGEEKFAASLKTAKPITAEGISGDQHFLTEDNRFYLKSFSNNDEANVLTTAFLPDYVAHLEKHRDSILSRMLAMVVFEIEGRWSNTKYYVLVMENIKYYIKPDDSAVTFDLKGSKWKHRVKSDGGKRCSPLFPLGFWEKPESKPRRADGEDLDFVALRTQVSRSWFVTEEAKAHKAFNKAKNVSWGHMIESRLTKLPLHDDCLSQKNWIHGQKGKALALGKEFDFCKRLQTQFNHLGASLKDAQEKGQLQTPEQIKAGLSLFNVFKLCEAVVAGDERYDQTLDWKTWVREEKMQIENMRQFYGYPTKSGHDMETKPLVVEPCMKAALMSQIAADVQFLKKHNLMDYSMDLTIKYETDPDTCISERASSGQPHKDNLFMKYKGGMRAVGEKGAPAEKAVYSMQILDFLSPWSYKKAASTWLQAGLASNKLDNKMPEVLKDLVDITGAHKCNNLDHEYIDPLKPFFCWTSCMSEPTCDSYVYGSSKLSTLSRFDFLRDTKEASLSCNGFLSSWKGTARALCVIGAKLGHREEAVLRNPLPSLPEPFKTQMSDAAIEAELAKEDAKHVLKKYLKQDVHPMTPVSLKRVAVMAYVQFSRRPYREDTVPVDEYAERFQRFVGAWISAPSQDEWQKVCPLSDGPRCEVETVAVDEPYVETEALHETGVSEVKAEVVAEDEAYVEAVAETVD